MSEGGLGQLILNEIYDIQDALSTIESIMLAGMVISPSFGIGLGSMGAFSG
jgi:hypothetical protein